MDPSDEALLAGFATGDPRTAAAFVRRFQGRVYGLALTIVRRPHIAEEVAQETFARVWRHADAYDERKGRVSTWLLSITRNLAIDITRMRRIDPVDPEVVAAELSLREGSRPADETGTHPTSGSSSAPRSRTSRRISAEPWSWRRIRDVPPARSAPSRTFPSAP